MKQNNNFVYKTTDLLKDFKRDVVQQCIATVFVGVKGLNTQCAKCKFFPLLRCGTVYAGVK